VPGYSIELCGGTHVSSSAQVGPFVLLSESSVGAGVRRVEAVTSGAAWAILDERARELESLRGEVDRLRKAPKAAAAEASVDVPDPDIRAEGGINVIVQPIEGLDADALLELSDRYKQKHAPAAVVLGSREDGKVHLVANFDDSVAARVSALDVVREAAAIVGGGGGGRPTMARAGGKDPEKLPDALARAEELIVGAL
jgi:alanyl-tRNA synthetase